LLPDWLICIIINIQTSIIEPNMSNLCFIKVEISVIPNHPLVIMRELWHIIILVFNECETIVIREIVALTLTPLADWLQDQGEWIRWVWFDWTGVVDFV